MRHLVPVPVAVLLCFNPRICKRCDLIFSFCFDSCCCFNPRICKRCDFDCKSHFFLLIVSIHASVKDATLIPVLMSLPSCFNPRICKRCDFGSILSRKRIKVSIHASVKDATFALATANSDFQCFNPRICKRCDPEVIPAPPCTNCFNPRICKRCDFQVHRSYTG